MVSRMDASPGPLRAVRSWEEATPDRGEDEGVLEAMLLTAGEKGYAKATVGEVGPMITSTSPKAERKSSLMSRRSFWALR